MSSLKEVNKKFPFLLPRCNFSPNLVQIAYLSSQYGDVCILQNSRSWISWGRYGPTHEVAFMVRTPVTILLWSAQ